MKFTLRELKKLIREATQGGVDRSAIARLRQTIENWSETLIVAERSVGLRDGEAERVNAIVAEAERQAAVLGHGIDAISDVLEAVTVGGRGLRDRRVR